MHTNKNSPFEWVPASFLPRQEYEEFRRDFGSGEVLVVSWPGCTVDSPILANVVTNCSGPICSAAPPASRMSMHVISGQDASAA